MVIYGHLTEPSDAGSTGGDSHITGLEESATLVSWSQLSALTGIFLSQASSWDPPITSSSSH